MAAGTSKAGSLEFPWIRRPISRNRPNFSRWSPACQRFTLRQTLSTMAKADSIVGACLPVARRNGRGNFITPFPMKTEEIRPLQERLERCDRQICSGNRREPSGAHGSGASRHSAPGIGLTGGAGLSSRPALGTRSQNEFFSNHKRTSSSRVWASLTKASDEAVLGESSRRETRLSVTSSNVGNSQLRYQRDTLLATYTE